MNSNVISPAERAASQNGQPGMNQYRLENLPTEILWTIFEFLLFGKRDWSVLDAAVCSERCEKERETCIAYLNPVIPWKLPTPSIWSVNRRIRALLTGFLLQTQWQPQLHVTPAGAFFMGRDTMVMPYGYPTQVIF